MRIIVDGHDAVLKKDFSFDYVAENRLFLGRDGYTLNISFPLVDCPENRAIFGHINRLDVSKERISLECLITSHDLSLFGALSVVKISDTEVECQFAEGRCAQTVTDPFEDTFISHLDLGKPAVTSPSEITPRQAWRTIDKGANEVALPWVNENYPDVPNNWIRYEQSDFHWESETVALSWQPYLIVIAKRICDAIGYGYDFSEWETSPQRFLIICNTLPGSWYMPEYAKALPEWTVSEFFEKLELFLMCEFDFDHRAKSVRMRFSKNILDNIAPVAIENLVDSYTAEMSQEDSVSCEYIASRRLAYKECSHSMCNYYSCDWYVNAGHGIQRYATLAELIEKNKRREVPVTDVFGKEHTDVEWGEKVKAGILTYYTTGMLLYAEDVDTYFVFRSIGTEYLGAWRQKGQYTQVYVLQPVNVFGSGSIEDESDSAEEIEFVPVCIMDTRVSESDDRGFMMFLRPPESDSSAVDVSSSSTSAISQPYPSATIAKGEPGASGSCYDEIYVAFWDGKVPEKSDAVYPAIDAVTVGQDWTVRKSNFSMRLTGKPSTLLRPKLPQIDPRQKYKFSWLDSGIPNPRAIFFIRGKRYLCEKITATFTENGMSQLLKGEFYPLLDD